MKLSEDEVRATGMSYKRQFGAAEPGVGCTDEMSIDPGAASTGPPRFADPERTSSPFFASFGGTSTESANARQPSPGTSFNFNFNSNGMSNGSAHGTWPPPSSGETPVSQPFSGQPPASQSLFGQPPASQQIFGQTPVTQPAFGQTPVTQPAFGNAVSQPLFGQAPVSQPLFGPAPASQPLFGQAPVSQPAFNQTPVTQPALGNAVSQPTFGQAPATQPAVDKAPVSQAAFGQAPVTQLAVDQAPASKPAFGQTPVSQPASSQATPFAQTSMSLPSSGQASGAQAAFNQDTNMNESTASQAPPAQVIAAPPSGHSQPEPAPAKEASAPKPAVTGRKAKMNALNACFTEAVARRAGSIRDHGATCEFYLAMRRKIIADPNADDDLITPEPKKPRTEESRASASFTPSNHLAKSTQENASSSTAASPAGIFSLASGFRPSTNSAVASSKSAAPATLFGTSLARETQSPSATPDTASAASIQTTRPVELPKFEPPKFEPPKFGPPSNFMVAFGQQATKEAKKRRKEEEEDELDSDEDAEEWRKQKDEATQRKHEENQKNAVTFQLSAPSGQQSGATSIFSIAKPSDKAAEKPTASSATPLFGGASATPAQSSQPFSFNGGSIFSPVKSSSTATEQPPASAAMSLFGGASATPVQSSQPFSFKNSSAFSTTASKQPQAPAAASLFSGAGATPSQPSQSSNLNGASIFSMAKPSSTATENPPASSATSLFSSAPAQASASSSSSATSNKPASKSIFDSATKHVANGSGGLFSHLSKQAPDANDESDDEDDDGENDQGPSKSVDAGPKMNLGTSILRSKQKSPATAGDSNTPSQETIADKGPTDQTWKENKPIKFGNASETSSLFARATAQTAPTKQPSSQGLFGSPTTPKAASLFGTSNNSGPGGLFGNADNSKGGGSANIFGSTVPSAKTGDAGASSGSGLSNETAGYAEQGSSAIPKKYTFGVTQSGTTSAATSRVNSRENTPSIAGQESGAESLASADVVAAGDGADDAPDEAQLRLDGLQPEEKAEWDVMFDSEGNAKFSTFADKKWEKKGAGRLFVLKHKTTGKTRYLARANAIGRVLLNSNLLSVEAKKVPKTRVQFTTLPTEGKLLTWLVTLASSESADELVDVIANNRPSS